MIKRTGIFGIRNIDILLMCFIFILLFALPVLFTRVDDSISWANVFKIWQDRALLIPIFILNHWVFVPRLVLKKQYKVYFSLVLAVIVLATFAYYIHDEPNTIRQREMQSKQPPPRPGERNEQPGSRSPSAVPPYANLLMFSLLIVAVDTGLSLTKNWHQNEEDKIRLEKENANVQLTILRNQVSPHFFMNTLNNIYALIDTDTQKSKQAVMKLSKLMRYLLYENTTGSVKLSKEFEFIRSYVDLMKIRFSGEVTIKLDIPEKYTDREIPVMLFISYIENAFKYGASYQQESFIYIIFEVTDEMLFFTSINSISVKSEDKSKGGLGMENNKKRLGLLFSDRYKLSVRETEKIFTVELNIPLT